MGTSEDGAFWLACVRCQSGVELVISDAHRGLDAKRLCSPVMAEMSHAMSNLLTRVPRSAQPWVATMVRLIYQQHVATGGALRQFEKVASRAAL